MKRWRIGRRERISTDKETSFIRNKDYIKVNLIIAGVLGLMFLYSAVFSAQGISHPIPSMAKGDVVSTGLSRAFSAIMRLNFQEALAYNPFSLHLFLFFFIQFFQRLIVSKLLFYNSIKQFYILIVDVLLSVLLFLWAFYAFVMEQFTRL